VVNEIIVKGFLRMALHILLFYIFASMINIAIFASGNGTNAQRIMDYFGDHPTVRVKMVLSNKKQAPVLERALESGIPGIAFSREDFYKSKKILDLLEEQRIGFIILAGFLWLIPKNILNRYPDRVINIHPALLPKFGGKGMFGMRVHESVLRAGEQVSGITIHYVNEKYDEGQIIFQEECVIEPGETPESLAGKVHNLEYEYFPVIIEALAPGLEEEDQ
jgi:phosphoribosylglycinamide formyltransferase 1